ncbi:MAG: FecR family protein [Zoogloeaceae bacterium]|jgi:hypothetical protein|nr:FecR family protein [Zoogloeaceae bacterium]
MVLFGLAAVSFAQAADVGKVVHLLPGATVSRNGQTKALQKDAVLQNVDTIATNSTGQVRILFNDDTFLSFGGNTRVNLRDFAGAKKNAFNARLLQSAAHSASNAVRAQNPGGFGGINPTATAGGAGAVESNGAPILVNVKGAISAGLDYKFEFRINMTKGILFQGKLSDDKSHDDKTYRLDFPEGDGKIDAFGWSIVFTNGSVRANTPAGEVTHKDWKVTLSGSDALSALKSKLSDGGRIHVTGFKLQDAKGALVLEYSLTSSVARATSTSGGGNRPPKFY